MLGFLKTKRVPIEKIETVIGSNTSFNGHLKCDGNIRIDGMCEGGTIETVGNVLVSADGRVSAKIIAENVSVAGEVTGEIVAYGRLEIIGDGCVTGNVRVANFYKDEAARLEGTLSMSGEPVESAAEDSAPEPEESAADAPENGEAEDESKTE